jgi:hypothetical protein
MRNRLRSVSALVIVAAVVALATTYSVKASPQAGQVQDPRLRKTTSVVLRRPITRNSRTHLVGANSAERQLSLKAADTRSDQVASPRPLSRVADEAVKRPRSRTGPASAMSTRTAIDKPQR